MAATRFFQTAGIAGAASEDPRFALEVEEALSRFRSGDWGDAGEDSQAMNDEDPDDALGVYPTRRGNVWIKADDYGDDGVVATVLFPDEW